MANIFVNATQARANTRNNVVIHGEIKTIESEGKKASAKMADIATGKNTTGQVGFKEGGLASKKKTKKKKK